MLFRGFITLLVALCCIQPAVGATILVWGDSLSAGYGIDSASAWPTLLKERLKREGYRYSVVNASISGETTAGGLARLPAELARSRPSIILIELGANDGLRSLPLGSMRKNISAMITMSQQTGARVVLIGVHLPPNFGPVFNKRFHDIFTGLAASHKTAFVPYLMDGFAQNQQLFQSDGLHPIAQAQPLILNNVWPVLRPLLGKPAIR